MPCCHNRCYLWGISPRMANSNKSLYFSKHVPYVNCTREKNVLLILDNHKSHNGIEIIDCTHPVVVVLQLLSHYSYKMQPLDGVVLGPKTRGKL